MKRSGCKAVLAVLPALIALAGCQLERDPGVRSAWERAVPDAQRMRGDPRPLARPVVVLGGYRSPPFHASGFAGGLVGLTSGRSADVLVLSFPLSSDLDEMARRVIDSVERRWPSTDQDQTIGVDVVGISMGGVLARWAALPPQRRHRGDDKNPATEPGKRLRVERLFTLATPHQGALQADWIAPDRAARDMRRGSPMLRVLDAELPDAAYELVCYAHRGDGLVGTDRAAPAGRPRIETEGTVLFSHLLVTSNPVFQVDIARRLRGEPPLVEGRLSQ